MTLVGRLGRTRQRQHTPHWVHVSRASVPFENLLHVSSGCPYGDNEAPTSTSCSTECCRTAPTVRRHGRGPSSVREQLSPRSRLGEKLTYIANQWDGLLVFLYDGRVEMDSNFVENRIRPIRLTAKNALFAGHDEGARSWGRIGSLIETCKLNTVEPCAWLKSTLEKIAAGHPQSRIRELLPWNFDPASS